MALRVHTVHVVDENAAAEGVAPGKDKDKPKIALKHKKAFNKQCAEEKYRPRQTTFKTNLPCSQPKWLFGFRYGASVMLLRSPSCNAMSLTNSATVSCSGSSFLYQFGYFSLSIKYCSRMAHDRSTSNFCERRNRRRNASSVRQEWQRCD